MAKHFRYFISVALAAFSLTPAFAKGSRSGSVYVRSYVRKDGTFVPSHYRSAPNHNFYDNWNTKGNYNPYTGQPGTYVSPYGSGYGYDSYGTSGNSSGSLNMGGNLYDDTANSGIGSANMRPNTNTFLYDSSALDVESQQLPSLSPSSKALLPGPINADDWLNYARQLSSVGNYEAALYGFAKAYSINPTDDLKNEFAIAYCQLAKTKNIQESFPYLHKSLAISWLPVTEQCLNEALRQSKRNPLSVKQRLIAADIAHRLNDDIGEIVECLAAVHMEAHNAEAHLRLARALHRSGLYKAALDEFQQCQKLGVAVSRVEAERERCERLKNSPSVLPAVYFSELR